MAARIYTIYNGASGGITTGPLAMQASGATSGTARTMLQLAASATNSFRLLSWGYLLSAIPGSFPTIDALNTGAVFCSGLTAHVAAGVGKWGAYPSADASDLQLGTALTGYSTGATTEGTITAPILYDMDLANGLRYENRFELGREPEIAAGTCFRIRCTPSSAAAITMACWARIEA